MEPAKFMPGLLSSIVPADTYYYVQYAMAKVAASKGVGWEGWIPPLMLLGYVLLSKYCHAKREREAREKREQEEKERVEL